MTDNTIRGDILELASKLNEGDYLKIANILKTAVEPSEQCFYNVKYLKAWITYDQDNGDATINYYTKSKIMKLSNEEYEVMLKNKKLYRRNYQGLFVEDFAYMCKGRVDEKIKRVYTKNDEEGEIVLEEELTLMTTKPIISIEKI